MKIEEYLSLLESQNKECGCPALQDLNEQRRLVSSLEGQCNFYKRNVDLKNPAVEDTEFIREYRARAEKLGVEIARFRKYLRQNLESEGLYLVRHDPNLLRPLGRISIEEAVELQANELILTAHCSTCDTQVSLI